MRGAFTGAWMTRAPGRVTLAAMWSADRWTDDEARACVGAMRWIARRDGEELARESAWIDAAAGALEVDRHAGAMTPDEVARRVARPAMRERIVQSAILAALADERVDDLEASGVRALARALEVDEPRVRNLEQLARGRVRAMWLDLARRSFARATFERQLRQHGLGGLWRIVGPMLGLARDPVLAQRFIALGELPDGTLGRAYFRFLVDEGLSFPGEPGSVPEAGLWHDVTHVLAGYRTSDDDEVRVVCFIAGNRRDDPFFWVFTIALQYHLGLKVSPYSPARRGLFLPEVANRDYERGARVAVDLESWDPWPHFGRPLEDVRRELGITRRDDPGDRPPDGAA